AARMLYLNRTAFGGIYRINRQGEFNVPYGGGQRTTASLWEKHLICRASRVLQNTMILHSDFESVLNQAQVGDVVYCDPTYTVTHGNNGFRRYNEPNFSWADQERLAAAAKRAASKGVTVFVSNAHHESLRSLYSGASFRVFERHSCVAATPL